MRFFVYDSFLLLSLFLVSCRDQEKFLLGGSGWDKVVILDKASERIEWEYPLEKGWECNSVTFTPSGNILFSYRKGAMEVDRSKNTLWKIEVPEGAEMQSANVLPDGNYLLAATGHPSRIMEVDTKGKILSQTEFETGIAHPHAQFRQVSKGRDGNYIVPLMSRPVIRIIDKGGRTVREIGVPALPFAVMETASGDYWVAGGDAHTLSLVDLESGEVKRIYRQNDIKGIKLFFVAGIHASGHHTIYISNWKGHSSRRETDGNPPLFELDENGHVVWQPLSDSLGMISGIDVSGAE